MSAAFLSPHVYLAALHLAWGLDVPIQKLRKKPAGDSYRMLQGLTSAHCVVQCLQVRGLRASSRFHGLIPVSRSAGVCKSISISQLCRQMQPFLCTIFIHRLHSRPFCGLYLGSFKVLQKATSMEPVGILSPPSRRTRSRKASRGLAAVRNLICRESLERDTGLWADSKAMGVTVL